MRLINRLQNWANLLKRDVMVLWFAVKNPETPLVAKSLAVVAVAYALSPIDLIPDFIPILGYIDDIILIPMFVWITLKFVPEEVISQSRQQAISWLSTNKLKPKSYLGLAIILFIWLFVSVALFQTFIKT